MSIIFFMLAGLIALWVLISMIKFMGIKEFVVGCLFVSVLIILVCGVLRASSNEVGCADKALPGVWGDVERVFR